jgi:hypothetical protein
MRRDEGANAELRELVEGGQLAISGNRDEMAVEHEPERDAA